jgi:hypothetical protein
MEVGMKSLLFCIIAVALLLPVALTAQQSESVRGRIVNRDGNTIDDVQIHISGIDGMIAISDDGWFSLFDLPSGDYQVELSVAGYQHYTTKLHLTGDRVSERNYVMLLAEEKGGMNIPVEENMRTEDTLQPNAPTGTRRARGETKSTEALPDIH